MKKFLLSLTMILALIFVSSSSYALNLVIQDWKFNPSGVDGSLPAVFHPIDQITFLGTTFIDQDGIGPGTTFTDTGAFQASGFANDGAIIPVGTTGLNLNYELTGVFDATGVNNSLVGTTQNFTFNSGGSLDLYLDLSLNYGSTDSFFGANDGTLIASFDLTAGDGNFNFDTTAGGDGFVNIAWLATYLAPNVWFDKNDVDLSTLVADDLVGAITDSNNNLIDPTATMVNEWTEFFGNGTVQGSLVGGDLEDFYTSNDGSFIPTVVPEPATLMIFGLGLLGLAGITRRKNF